MATKSPGRASECRRALKVVTPAQSKGAASANEMPSGTNASASTGTIMGFGGMSYTLAVDALAGLLKGKQQ